MNYDLILSAAIVGFSLGVCFGVAFAVLTLRRYEAADARADARRAEARARAARAIGEPDLFDEAGRAHVEGLEDSTTLNQPRAAFFRTMPDGPFPPKPYSEFDGPGQHASSAPLFSQRTRV